MLLRTKMLVVDVVVNVNGNNITLQKLPASLDVADQGTAKVHYLYQLLGSQ